ncbi:hypothetical protein C2S51_015353 [Perilla frutescens var. frutescens]|nr:hypothetical protein C2S51_015353 [Perilla frutescens var. frutescens]
MVDNNFCESFNFTILTVRKKPIVSMRNEIRRDAMKRIALHKAGVEKWTSEWSPNCMKVYQNNMDDTFGCMVSFNGADDYEIGDGEDNHTVFLAKQLCICRAWDLS